MENLKPCPFCGEEAVTETITTVLEKAPRYRIKCPKCHADIGWDHFSIEEAAAAWNKRSGEEGILAEYLMYAEASGSILSSINLHCMSLDDASKIIMLCGPACDALSPDGFIKWLKDRITDDPRIREEMENDRM